MMSLLVIINVQVLASVMEPEYAQVLAIVMQLQGMVVVTIVLIQKNIFSLNYFVLVRIYKFYFYKSYKHYKKLTYL
jgi:hypothetical protein